MTSCPWLFLSSSDADRCKMGVVCIASSKEHYGETTMHVVMRNKDDNPDPKGLICWWTSPRSSTAGGGQASCPHCVPCLCCSPIDGASPRAMALTLSGLLLFASLYPLGSRDLVSFPFPCKPKPDWSENNPLPLQLMAPSLSLNCHSNFDLRKCASSELPG